MNRRDYFSYLHPYTIILPQEADRVDYTLMMKANFFRRVLEFLGIDVRSESRSMPTDPQIIYRFGGRCIKATEFDVGKRLYDIIHTRVPEYVYSTGLIGELTHIVLPIDKPTDLIVANQRLDELIERYNTTEKIIRFNTEYHGFGVYNFHSTEEYDTYLLMVDDSMVQDDDYTRFNTSVNFMTGVLTRLSKKRFGSIVTKYNVFDKSSGTLVWARYPEFLKDDYHSDVCSFLADCGMDLFDKQIKWFSHNEPTSSIRFMEPFMQNMDKKYMDFVVETTKELSVFDWATDRDWCRHKRLINISCNK